MKTIYTLLVALVLCGTASNVVGQSTSLNQPFNADIGVSSNYPGWTFNTSGSALYWTPSQNNHTINTGTLVFDQSTASGVVTAGIVTSNQTFFAGSVTFSFNYDLHGNLSGGSYRKITLNFMDGSGNLTPIDSLLLTTAVSGVQTFTTTKLVVATMQRRLFLYLEGKSSGSTYLLIDNLNITDPFGIVPVPVKLVSFQGNISKNNAVTLQWQVANNETSGYFEVQRSFNGIDYSTVGVVKATGATSSENYQYEETINTTDKAMYRLKMVDKFNSAEYSKIVMLQNKTSVDGGIKIYGNPVSDLLKFSLTSNATQNIQVKVYDFSAHQVLTQNAKTYPGDNMIALSLSDTFKPGLYVVEVNNGVEKYTAKFVKQ